MKKLLKIIFIASLLGAIPGEAFLQEKPGVVVEQSQDEKEPEFEEVPPEEKKQRFADAILISGNTVFTKDEISQKMSTVSGKVFNKPGLKSDIEKILVMYRDNGWIFAVISKSEELVSEDENYLYVVLRLNIEEGKKYLIGKVGIEGNLTYPDNFVMRMLGFVEGELFNKGKFEGDINSILLSYQSDGFPDARIKPAITVQDETGEVDILLSIDEGKRGQIGIIEVVGNKGTKSNIIIREMRITEGEYYTDEKLEEIKRRLRKMQFVRFEDLKLLDTDVEGQIKMVVKVKEVPSNKFGGVVGYSPPPPDDEEAKGYWLGNGDLHFQNLFGTARKVRVHLERKSKNRYIYELGLTEPWMFGQPVEVDFNFKQEEELRREGEPNEYEYTETDWHISFITAFTQFFSGVFRYGHTINDVFPERDDAKNSQSFNFTLGSDFDTLDIPWNPKKGFKDDLFITFKLKKSKENIEERTFNIDTITKVNVNLRHFFSLSENLVFAARANGRMTFSKLEIPDYEYYKLGGAKDLRGYFEDKFRGTRLLLANLELRFLLSEESYFMAFIDTGVCWVEEDKGETIWGNIIHEINGGLGYGIGISMKAAIGQINFNLALGKKDNLGNFMRVAKIHVAVETKF